MRERSMIVAAMQCSAVQCSACSVAVQCGRVYRIVLQRGRVRRPPAADPAQLMVVMVG
jgi:hypothetical protein